MLLEVLAGGAFLCSFMAMRRARAASSPAPGAPESPAAPVDVIALLREAEDRQVRRLEEAEARLMEAVAAAAGMTVERLEEAIRSDELDAP